MKGHANMKKNEFLEKLAQKIKILNKDEIADIISEYAGYIDNKIAEGKSEEAAVADFGDVNDLAKEILSAYKLSDDYISSDEFSGSKFFNDTANILNKSVEFTAGFFKDIYTHTNANRIVNILITLFVALILVAILKIPFLVIDHLGRGFIHFVFPYFMNNILSFVWILFCNIIYLIVVIFIFVSLLKGGFGANIGFIKNWVEDAAKRKKEYKEKYGKDWHKHYNEYYQKRYRSNSAGTATPKTDFSEVSVPEEPEPEPSDNEDHASVKSRKDKDLRNRTSTNPFTILLKICINILAVILLIPLFPSAIVLGIVAGILIYLLTQGISVYGLTLLVIGFFFLFTSFISLISEIIYKHGKKLKSHIAGILIASVLIGFGGVFSFFEFMKYDYIDTIPEMGEFMTKRTYTYDITTDKVVINANGAVLKYVIDNTLEERIILEMKHNNLYNEIDIRSTIINKYDDNTVYNHENGKTDNSQIITVHRSSKNTRVRDGFFPGTVVIKAGAKSIFYGLKDKKIYNIKNSFIPEITVYLNEAVLEKIKTSGQFR